MTQCISDTLDSIKQHTYQAKQALEQFYADESVDLDVKWFYFVNAPDYLKNNDHYTFHSLKYLDGSDVEFEQFYHLDRYRTYSTEGLVECMQDAADDPECYELDKTLTQEDVKHVRSQILALNLGSFTHDW